MYQKILDSLREHFPQYNDYKLGRIAYDIQENIKSMNISEKNICVDCMFFPTLPTTFVGTPPNLCQKGLERNKKDYCPYFCKGSSLVNDSSYSFTSKSIEFK